MCAKAASKLRKNILRLVILTVAGSLIYGLPYFRSYYYDAYVEAYQLTNTQMGTLGSIFGIFGMISYLFGGVVADMIPARKLLSISLVLTGGAGLLQLLHPGYKMLVIIYIIWGFTSLFAFWPALLKRLRSLASADEQSKAFGFMEAGRGIMGAVHLAVALSIFKFLSGAISEQAGLNGIITFYASVDILLGILVFLFMKDEPQGEQESMEGRSGKRKSGTIDVSQVMAVIRMPAVWILAMILCCTYTMNMSFYYFTPFATASFGITTAAAAAVTIMAQYIRPLASASGGVLADRAGRSKVLLIGFTLMGICTFTMALMKDVSVPMFIVLCAIIYFAMYFNYGVTFSMMDEGGIPQHVAGTASGLICTLGYLPEVICPTLAGHILDTYSGMGYKYYFLGVGAMMVLGIAVLGIWNRYLKKMQERKA